MIGLRGAVPLAPGYASEPFWWDGVEFPTTTTDRPPGDADIVVVGAGYTGLAVAYEAARRGRAVVVLDRDDPARGASSRNGGMVLPGLKSDLATTLAAENGRALWEETVAALEGLGELIDEHRVDCDWTRSGHVELAHHPRAARRFAEVARSFDSVGEGVRFLEKDELTAEIGSDRFCGALVVERSASIHPGKWAAALLSLAMSAGACVVGHCAVRHVERGAAGFRVDTERGPVHAREVVVATNATTDASLSGWLARRILPVG
ncbi:MAG: NAD(P)/FAD-dependent oxidoreductase, partial [Acidimicrobiales bacterium]